MLLNLEQKNHAREEHMVEAYLRSRLGFVLDGLLKCAQHGDEHTVGLGWVHNPPVDNLDLARGLCTLLGHPLLAHTLGNTKGAGVVQWSVGPWTCAAATNRVLVVAIAAPSAHAILAAKAARNRLETMDVEGLVGPGCGSLWEDPRKDSPL
jgi:hypothetical protein